MALGGGLFDDLTSYGGAAADLLGNQLTDETAEMKRRKDLLRQMQEAVSPLGASNMLGLANSAFSGMSRLGGLRASRGG